MVAIAVGVVGFFVRLGRNVRAIKEHQEDQSGTS
jgi:hypothetical protein